MGSAKQENEVLKFHTTPLLPACNSWRSRAEDETRMANLWVATPVANGTRCSGVSSDAMKLLRKFIGLSVPPVAGGRRFRRFTRPVGHAEPSIGYDVQGGSLQ
jgi:hypothetical protein